MKNVKIKLNKNEYSRFYNYANNMMNIIIQCVDYWLQYGVVYDYISAQGFKEC